MRAHANRSGGWNFDYPMSPEDLNLCKARQRDRRRRIDQDSRRYVVRPARVAYEDSYYPYPYDHGDLWQEPGHGFCRCRHHPSREYDHSHHRRSDGDDDHSVIDLKTIYGDSESSNSHSYIRTRYPFGHSRRSRHGHRHGHNDNSHQHPNHCYDGPYGMPAMGYGGHRGFGFPHNHMFEDGYTSSSY